MDKIDEIMGDLAKLTEKAWFAMQVSSEIADSKGVKSIEDNHLLWGLSLCSQIDEEDELKRLFNFLDFSLSDLIIDISEQIAPVIRADEKNQKKSGIVRGRVKELVSNARRISQELDSRCIATIHLFLALVEDERVQAITDFLDRENTNLDKLKDGARNNRAV